MRNADTEKPYENKYERLETLKFEEKLFYVYIFFGKYTGSYFF